MSEIKLLPCPCCNGEAEFNEIGTQINCKECGLTLDVSECYEQGFSNARDTMIKKWNTRKPMERILTRLEEKSYGIKLEGALVASDKTVVELKDAVKIVKEEGGIE